MFFGKIKDLCTLLCNSDSPQKNCMVTRNSRSKITILFVCFVSSVASCPQKPTISDGEPRTSISCFTQLPNFDYFFIFKRNCYLWVGISLVGVLILEIGKPHVSGLPCDGQRYIIHNYTHKRTCITASTMLYIYMHAIFGNMHINITETDQTRGIQAQL